MHRPTVLEQAKYRFIVGSTAEAGRFSDRVVLFPLWT